MNKVLCFLKQSNNIENVWDDDSLYRAYSAWEYLCGYNEITIIEIKKAHHILMLKHLGNKVAGCLRQQSVWIGGREAIHFGMIKAALYDWCEDLKESKNWKSMHIQFEKIHPFIDGNGRIGRILMNWHRLKLGLPIKIIIETEKYNYYKWFVNNEKCTSL